MDLPRERGSLQVVAKPPSDLTNAREARLSGVKIAVVGAGSVGFTRKLISDILCVPELRDIEFALTDLSAHNLELVGRIINTMIEVNKLPTKVSATTDRRRALEGADYVISCVRVGGIEAYADDIRIPLKYGVDQCVGDTICAGGLLYGQRNVPVILDFCHDIREVAASDALFLNYANPDGDQYLGRPRARQGQDSRALPRRTAWRGADRRRVWGRNAIRISTTSAPESTIRPGSSTSG